MKQLFKSSAYISYRHLCLCLLQVVACQQEKGHLNHALDKHPGQAPPSTGAVVIEIPYGDTETDYLHFDRLDGRLLGGMQEPSGDEKLLAEELKNQPEAQSHHASAPLAPTYLPSKPTSVQALRHAVLNEDLPQVIAALKDLAQIEQAKGTPAADGMAHYNNAAKVYQIMLRACEKDQKRDHCNDIKAAQEGLVQLRAAMTAGRKKVSVGALQAEIQKDKQELATLRAYTRKRVKELEDILHQEGMTQEQAHKAEQNYIEGSRKVFESISQALRKFLSRLYRECEQELGPPPCKYAVMGMGSMASQQMTPYSNLAFSILVEAPKDNQQANQWRAYLRKLTHLVHFRVINLGESVPLGSEYGVRLDHLCQPGVRIDLSGHTPLNRSDAPCDLIQPVGEMLLYLQDEEHKTAYMDKHLPAMLENTCYVYGDQTLYQSYEHGKQIFLRQGKTAEGLPVHKARALRRLAQSIAGTSQAKPSKTQKNSREDVAQLYLTLIGNTSVARRLYNVKQAIFCLPDHLLYGLAPYYAIHPTSCWEAVEQLAQQKIIDAGEAVHHLQFAVSFATMLRLRTHLQHQSQLAQIMLPTDRGKELESRTAQALFNLPEIALAPSGSLFRYYYTALPLYSKLHKFVSAAYACDQSMGQQQSRPDAAHESSGPLLKKSYNLEEEGSFFRANKYYDSSAYVVGRIYYKLCRLDHAITVWKRALEEECRKCGDKHSYVAKIHSNLGEAYRRQGNASAAFKHYEAGLRIWKTTLGEYHAHVAGSYNNMGLVLDDQGKYAEAVKYYEEGLRIWKVVLGEDHLSVAASHSNLGEAYRKQGNYPAALKHYEEELRLQVAIYGEQYPRVATTYYAMGLVYQKQQNYPEALRCYQKSLRLRVAILGKDHPDVANSCYQIGLVCEQQGSYGESIKYLKMCLRLREQALGKQHPHVADSCNDIGLFLDDWGNYEEGSST